MEKKVITKWVAKDGKEFDTEMDCVLYEKENNLLNTYEVELHFSGTYYTTVEAYDEDEALHIARENMYNDTLDWDEDDNYVELVK